MPVIPVECISVSVSFYISAFPWYLSEPMLVCLFCNSSFFLLVSRFASSSLLVLYPSSVCTPLFAISRSLLSVFVLQFRLTPCSGLSPPELVILSQSGVTVCQWQGRDKRRRRVYSVVSCIDRSEKAPGHRKSASGDRTNPLVTVYLAWHCCFIYEKREGETSGIFSHQASS